MRFSSALSEHPESVEAAGEVIGRTLEALGEGPDLVVVFASAHHREAFPQLCSAMRRLLRPVTLLGAVASAVVGGDREVEAGPALSVWAGCGLGGARPVRLGPAYDTGPASAPIAPGPSPLDAVGSGTLVLLADPFSFDADRFARHLGATRPDLDVVGGLLSAGRGPGRNQLVLDGAAHWDGAVGVVLDAGTVGATVVSQGCRPVGQPFTVTRASGNLIEQIAGRPAVALLNTAIEQCPPEEQALLRRGIQIGRVVDEHRSEFGPGDFLVRAVLGVDRATGGLVVGDEVEIGATVQFHVRDEASADDDLRRMLAGAEADAALLFTCDGRGASLFGVPDHDVTVLNELTGSRATAGMFCGGELGRIGGQPHVHGFTATMALFGR